MINELIAKTIETMKEGIFEYSHSVHHRRKEYNFHNRDSSLGSPKSEVNLYDDFKPFYLTRSNLHDNMTFPSLEQKSDHSVSLSHDLALEFSSHSDVTKDVIISVDQPTTFYDSLSLRWVKTLRVLVT